jgi:hypothetical protein
VAAGCSNSADNAMNHNEDEVPDYMTIQLESYKKHLKDHMFTAGRKKHESFLCHCYMRGMKKEEIQVVM